MEQAAIHQKGISASSLKLIAVFTMLIDHIGAVILFPLITGGDGYYDWINVYQIMRNIGRIAFPIYCFMLVEGFLRTGNIRNYLTRLFLMALISEIPFNLALGGEIFVPRYQNVMFTLVIGLTGRNVSEEIVNNEKKQCAEYLLIGLVWLAAMLLAEGISADYGAKGILSIGIMYVLRHDKKLQMFAGALSFILELPAPLAFVPLWFYNGRKGKSMKGFFYGFYPVHLLILYLIRLVLIMAI